MPKAMSQSKPKSRSKYYNKYKQLKNSPTIYPNPYDSLIVYYNRLVVYTDLAASSGAFEAAYRIQREATHVALRPYFGQYRVEKVTMRLQFAEGPSFNNCFMATTHSPDGATVAASTPTIQSIRNYKDYTMFQTYQNCPKKSWYFKTEDPNEYTYRDVAAATITNDDEFHQGGVQFFVSNIAGAGTAAVTCHVQFKVRYIGKQAVSI